MQFRANPFAAATSWAFCRCLSLAGRSLSLLISDIKTVQFSFALHLCRLPHATESDEHEP